MRADPTTGAGVGARVAAQVTRRRVLLLAALIAIGELVRLAVAAKGVGVAYDLRSYDIVRHRLLDDPWHAYDVNAASSLTVAPRWPYPPGFFPFLVGIDAVSVAVAKPFSEILRMVISSADVLLALVIWTSLRARAGEARALAGAACVLLGPVFILVSADHGQLDAFAWLPAAVALLVWQSERWGPNRAVIAGLLIGAAIALKTVPGLMLLALLPTVRSRREAVTLVVAAVAVPLLLYLPFLSERDDIARGLRYHGVPGLGGISMLVQPSLAAQLLQYGPIRPTGASRFLLEHGSLITGLAVLATFAVLVRRRTPAPEASAILVLVTLVCGFNYLAGYSVWALIVLLLAGRVGWALALQLLLTPPTVMVYAGLQTGRVWSEPVVYGLYVPFMAIVLASWTSMAWRLLRARPAAI